MISLQVFRENVDSWKTREAEIERYKEDLKKINSMLESSWGNHDNFVRKPLEQAAYAIDDAIVSQQWELKIDGNKLLHIAVELRDVKSIADILSANIVDINAQEFDYGRTALMKAVLSNQFEAVKMLIENGADVLLKDCSQKTAIDYALYKKDKDVICLVKDAAKKQKLARIKAEGHGKEK